MYLLVYAERSIPSESPGGLDLDNPGRRGRKDISVMVHRTALPWYPEHIPEELKVGRCWVCCDAQKVPLIAGKRKRASCSDPATWRSYDAAVRALERHPERYAGVGRVISAEDPYVGVDLDRVRDPVSRELSSEALGILRELSSYSEVSWSGRGVKTWVRSSLQRSYRKAGLEVYRGGRYFVLTGQFLPQFPLDIKHRQDVVDDLVAREFPQRPERNYSEPYDGPRVALVEYLDGVEVFGEAPDGKGLKLRILCPWHREHTHAPETGTYIGQFDDGGPYFICHHAHCAHRTWRDFRRATRINKFRVRKLELIKKGLY